MKRLITISIFLFIAALFSDSRAFVKEIYEWENVVVSGKGCFPPNCAQGQFPMAVLPLVAFENKLWSVGDKSVWTSEDGINWISQPKTDWGERHGTAHVFYAGKIWMLGGMKTWDDFRNDVWSSADGTNWKQVTAKAAWSPRRGHSVLVFKNKMWLLGGATSSGRRDETPRQFRNDVWFSENGVDWTQATANAPWSERDGHTGLVFNDQIWIIGGGKNRDVWTSADGKNWTQITAQAAWSERQGNGGLVFDRKIWIFGGMEKNDVWFSADGANWQMAAQVPWSSRTTRQSIVFDNKLWLFSGKTGREDSWSGDIWTMSRKLH